MTRRFLVCLAGVLTCGALAPDVGAQPLGTFRWQLLPFCNVVTVAITQNGSVYRLEGTDDQCANGADAASVTGTAFPNADGTIGFGLNLVTAPGGRPLHVDAEITIGTFSGTWRDSAGATGTFAITPGAGSGGNPRPLPSAVPSTIVMNPDGGFVAGGALGAGVIPATGAGTRMMWYPRKAAFRAGDVSGSQWDDANVGQSSVAFGSATRASGINSTAMGGATTASSTNSTAMGSGTTASGPASTAMGTATTASGPASTAMGFRTTASGLASFAGGSDSVAGGANALAFGNGARVNGTSGVALGTNAVASGNGSFAFADTSAATAIVAGANQFIVRAAGGVEFYSNPSASLGVRLAPNGTQWLGLSDARTKHRFRELDDDDVLAKIARMPVTEWSYKAQDAAIRHIGPTAQDFHAAFGLGEDPLRIGTLDADGVALAGVKALEARSREMQEQHGALRLRVAELERALAEALDLVRALKGGGR